MTDRLPLIKICGLYQNNSKSGRTYFVGVCGGVKYLLLEKLRPRTARRAEFAPRPREKPQQTAAQARNGCHPLLKPFAARACRSTAEEARTS